MRQDHLRYMLVPWESEMVFFIYILPYTKSDRYFPLYSLHMDTEESGIPGHISETEALFYIPHKLGSQ